MERQLSRRHNRRPHTFALAMVLGLGTSLSALASPTTLTVDPATVTAGPVPGTLNFNVTRSGDLAYDALLDYSTADGTALAGTDYTATQASVLFAQGATTGVLTVPVAADPGGNTLDKTLQLIVDSAIGLGPMPSFSAAINTGFVNNLGSVAVGDFNGDGKPDLAAASRASNGDVFILLNQTAPGAASTSYTLTVGPVIGSNSEQIVVADFNGDGLPDLATANDDGTASILFNATAPGAASASFTLAASLAVGTSPTGAAVGDFNGDGKPDLAVANRVEGTVSVLLNSTVPGASTAAFTLADSPAAGSFPSAVAVADLNGDGKPDLAVTNAGSNSVSILLNGTPTSSDTGSASFTLTAVPGVGGNPVAVAVADFNGDGKPDLAVVNPANPATNGSVSLLLNSTAPVATSASFTRVANATVGRSPGSAAVGDFNGDGKPDLAVANERSSSVSILLNRSQPGALDATGGRFTLVASPAVGQDPTSVAVGDFNGDGRPDLAAATDDDASVLLNTTPASTAPLSLSTATDVAVGTAPNDIAQGDFNGDGRVDLAVANSGSNTASILFNTTAPGATSPSWVPAGSFPVGSTPRAIVVADFNGDGRADVATANRDDNTVSILLNATPPGASSASFGLAVNFTGGGSPNDLVAGDFNGDGRPDLVAIRASNAQTILFLFNTTVPGATSASFAQAGSLSLNSSGYATTGDFNGDGRLDLAYGNGNRIQILLNNTAPGGPTANFAGGGMVSNNVGFSSVTSGDLNGDGRTDLVIGEPTLNALRIALNNTAPGATTTTFGGSRVPAGGDSYSVAVADFDGDGRLDVVSADALGTTASVALNGIAPGATGIASTDFTVAATVFVGSSPQSVVTADFNGDGKPDFATANSASNSVSVVLNTQLQANVAGSPATGTITYPDTTPDAFSFTPVTDATVNTVYTSNAITVSGLGAGMSAAVSVTGGSYSIGCTASFVTTPGSLVNGQTVCVRQTSSASFNTTTTATLSIGTGSADFFVTTEGIDTTPDPFMFTDQAHVPRNSVRTSNAVTLTGISTAAPISVVGGTYSIGCTGTFTAAAGTLGNGQTVCVRHTSAGTPVAVVSTTLSVGGITDSFTSTTAIGNSGLSVASIPMVIVTQGLQLRIILSPTATLRDIDTNQPLAGRTVNFAAGPTPLCSAVTNASGVAMCQANLLNTLAGVLSLGYTARFNGDATYLPSVGRGGILGLRLF